MNDTALQTRLESFIEAIINTVIGFVINFSANLLILPHFGFTSLTVKTNFLIGILYTVISVARSFAVRRWAQAKLRAFNVRVASAITRALRG